MKLNGNFAEQLNYALAPICYAVTETRAKIKASLNEIQVKTADIYKRAIENLNQTYDFLYKEYKRSNLTKTEKKLLTLITLFFSTLINPLTPIAILGILAAFKIHDLIKAKEKQVDEKTVMEADVKNQLDSDDFYNL